MKKRLLFCTHEQFWPLTGGCTAGNFNILNSFSKRGYDVTISSPLYINSEKIPGECRFSFKPFSPFYMHRNVKFRMFKYIFYSFLSTFHFINLIRKNTFDVIFVNNAVLTFPFIFIKPFIKTPVVLRYTDILSGFLYEHNKYPKLFVKLLEFYEYKVINLFDQVFVITENMKYAICKRSGIAPDKVHVVYDGVDGELFIKSKYSLNDRHRIRTELNIPREAKVVLFHGTIEPHHGEDILPQIVNHLTKNKNVYALLIGIGDGFKNIKAQLRENPNVRMLESLEYKKIPEYINASDVGIIPYPKNNSIDMILTLKFLEYLSMGVPCVLFELESIRDAFSQYDFVRVSKDMNEFVLNTIVLLDYGKSDASAQLIQSKFTWESVVERMLLQINSIVDHGRSRTYETVTKSN